jgi:predicted branched-subunit amino acid permease
MSVAKFEGAPAMPLREKVAYFFGVAAPVAPSWYIMTLVGAFVGKRIPPEFALDFAVPIAFIAVIAPMLRTLAHLAAALTSILGTLALAPLPYNSGLLVAAVLAMAAGAQAELWAERRRA